MDRMRLQQQGENEIARDSNIELYRIISMLLIIAHHYVVNSGLVDASGPVLADPMSLPSLFLLVLGGWGKIGINCFVLITGYFMCRSGITVKKFAKLLFEVMFYRLLISIIFWATGYVPFSFKELLKKLLPFTSVAQNFTGTYLIFFLCIPFINILIRHLNEKQHLRLLLLALFTYVFFGTVPGLSVTMNYVSWYIVLYLIASYIRLYPKQLFDSKRFWGIMAGVSVLLSAVSIIACTWLGARLDRYLSYTFVSDSNTFLAVLTGVSTFMLVKNIRIRPNRFINSVAATTFGVLLIHANGDAMRQWLWKDLLNNVAMYDSVWLPAHAIGSVLLIFVVCSGLDMLRIWLIEKPLLKLWDKHWGSFAEKYATFEEKLCKKLRIGTDQEMK